MYMYFFLSTRPVPVYLNTLDHLSLVTRKPVFGIFDQAWLKPTCSATQTRESHKSAEKKLEIL